VPVISAHYSTLPAMPREFRLWAERLLSRYVARALKFGPPEDAAEFNGLLQVFHLWAALFSFAPTGQTSGKLPTPEFELGLEVEYSRWDMWMAYYATLSELLKRDFIYAASYSDVDPKIQESRAGLTDTEYLTSRLKQRAELKNVEAKIETKLLEESSFPKANVRNDRVERWVDSVMVNWRVLCGPLWQNDELGEGGKNAISRGVLDVLYRAATKTFHCTRILRHLFTVHAYLAEFDLALKALDTYLEMVGRARERCEKTGHVDQSLDDNDKVLTTMSEAISILARFGYRKEAEKAREIAAKLLLWLDESDVRPEISETLTNGTHSFDKSASPSTIAAAYHALGIAEARWARMTYDASARSQLQNKAQDYFRLALHKRYRNSKNLDYLYSLAALLAEMRDISGSIRTVKQALADASSHPIAINEPYGTERKLIQFWHLLTLLLTARSDLLNAAKASNAAFEQFQDPGILFGHQEYRSEHLNELEKRPHPIGLVDRMSTVEKVGILQVKMTQVALLEALEGPDAAVDANLDLLALYSRLFGDPYGQEGKPTTAIPSRATKSRVGSLRASILGRVRSRRAAVPRMEVVAEPGASKRFSLRPGTSMTVTTAAPAPAIQVTDASGERGRTPRVASVRGRVSVSASGADGVVERSLSRRVARKRSGAKPSVESFHAASGEDEAVAVVAVGGANGTSQPRASVQSTRPSTAGTATTRSTRPLQTAQGNKRDSRLSMNTIDSDLTTSAGQDSFLRESTASASALPVPSQAERQNALATLADLWLFVAGTYSRADMHADAAGALDEAAGFAERLEREVAAPAGASSINPAGASAAALARPAWGARTAADAAWADVWGARGEAARAAGKRGEALSCCERALAYAPGHVGAAVGLADMLLDVFEGQAGMEEGGEEAGDPLVAPGAVADLLLGAPVRENGVAVPVREKPVASSTVGRSRASTGVGARHGRGTSQASSHTGTTASSIGGDTASPGATSPARRVRRPSGTASLRGVARPGTMRAALTAGAERALFDDDEEDEEDEGERTVASTTTATAGAAATAPAPAAAQQQQDADADPADLDRRAARDRALLLLGAATRAADGWDASEAWFGLARALECGGQCDRAREVLWWCVELEDSRPLRRWECAAAF
jgi:tetratricopeptide (TPR) repeat protein